MDRDVAQAAQRMQPEEHELKQLPILAVADDEPTLILLARTLERAGHANVHTTADPREVPALFGETASPRSAPTSSREAAARCCEWPRASR